ncbi:MAG: VIT1/CCC1 transporter family protein [Betaproteobacteria bacterium]|nr:VIT1/CCC1 transporter family protein [Betaproteobacteria bacterium]
MPNQTKRSDHGKEPVGQLEQVNHLSNWQEEKRSAWLYRQLALCSDVTQKVLFAGLADAAEHQALIWADALQQSGFSVPDSYRPDLRSRLVAALARLFGARVLRPILSAMKIRGMAIFNAPLPHHAMPASVEELLDHHQVNGKANLRAAVFGMNDGLVSNASLILGMAGATSDQTHLVILTGMAGLLAGAFSMASGEYVSVRSQREMYEYQIGLEWEELTLYPQEEAEELAMIYRAKGIAAEEAHRVAYALISDPDKALDTLAREELGLNPADLGSPWSAALSSFLAFCVGAGLPLLPFVAVSGQAALSAVIGVSAVALFVMGASLSLFTGRNALYSGLRMLLIGAGAGSISYVIGHALGVSLH